MNKIYDLTLGIEAESHEEAEQKLLLLQQIAVDYTGQTDNRANTVKHHGDLLSLGAALGILAMIGLSFRGGNPPAKKRARAKAGTNLDLKLQRYNWQVERRRQKQQEEQERKKASMASKGQWLFPDNMGRERVSDILKRLSANSNETD